MTASTTLTVRLAPQVKRRLESVALRVRRSKSFLAAEAIEEFLAVQEWQIAAVKEVSRRPIAATLFPMRTSGRGPRHLAPGESSPAAGPNEASVDGTGVV
jgi:predicted DNA-binding protein